MDRPLFVIAREIRKEWKNVYFGAEPYLQAMGTMTHMSDYYGADDAETIIVYFLGNAAYWRGEAARRIKKELKDLAGIE